MNNRSIFSDSISWLFGLVVVAIGIVNIFWGNDPGYGIFIFVLAFVYFPPAAALIKRIISISIPLIIKVFLGIFILWTALVVAELFDKIDLMMNDL